MQNNAQQIETYIPNIRIPIVGEKELSIGTRRLFPYGDLPLKAQLACDGRHQMKSKSSEGNLISFTYSQFKVNTFLNYSSWLLNKIKKQLLKKIKVPA